MLKNQLRVFLFVFITSVSFSMEPGENSLGTTNGISVREYEHRVAAHKEAVKILCKNFIHQYMLLGYIPKKEIKTFETYMLTRCDHHDDSKIIQDKGFLKNFGREQPFSYELSQKFGLNIPHKNKFNEPEPELRKAINAGINSVDDQINDVITKDFYELAASKKLAKNQKLFDDALNFVLNSDYIVEVMNGKTSSLPKQYRGLSASKHFRQRLIVALADEIEDLSDKAARTHEQALISKLHEKSKGTMFPESHNKTEFGRPMEPSSEFRKRPGQLELWGNKAAGEGYGYSFGQRLTRMTILSDLFEVTHREDVINKLNEEISPERVSTRLNHYRTRTEYHRYETPRTNQNAPTVFTAEIVEPQSRGSLYDCLSRALKNK